MARKLVIIGAGIAGLSAGIYARLNGYDVEIVEMHNLPGGLCTAWKRNGYTFDGCIHWLVGSGPGDPFHQLWLETGALPGDGVLDQEEFIRIEHSSGKELILYSDANRLERHLLELAPEDGPVIEEMCALIRRFAEFPFAVDTPRELMGPLGLLRMLRTMGPWLKQFNKYNKMPLERYWDRFRSPILRETLPRVFDVEDFPTMAFIMTMASLHKKSAGWVMGGSLEFARRMERRFLDLGGTIRYRSKVEKVLVERHKKATGVELVDGTRLPADIIISTADGFETIYNMLEGRHIDRKTKKSYKSEPVCFSSVQLSFGLKMDLSDTPHSRGLRLGRKVTLAGEETDLLGMRHYCYDPSMAPEGCSTVVCHVAGNYDWWAALANNKQAYQEAKAQIQEQVLEILEEHIPGFRQAMEVADVATPLTFTRFTGNRRGSIMGWATKVGSMTRQRRRTLPGLGNFYMAGQWVESGGGLPPAVLSGRQIVQVISHKDKVPFRASMPAS